MKKDKHTTNVRFLIEPKDGYQYSGKNMFSHSVWTELSTGKLIFGNPFNSVLAVFPNEKYSNANPFTVMCYSHVGQHSAASPEYIKLCAPATPEQYADLKAELESIGYNLNILP